ncbi:MAG TPA: phosphonopyruvate decarboxylase [bacterium]|nr:phosphonopyruvate decarboxylase [bacterium]
MMIDPEKFISFLAEKGTDLFTGVPDSTFKGLTTLINTTNGSFRHLAASNECEAVGIACGYHLATGKIPVVYMQNSGFGKTVNPYTSLASKDVYSIPVLMIIGWRGEPGKKDEPQHKMMGRITKDLLNVLEIENCELDIEHWQEQTDIALKYCKANSRPFAIIVKSEIFSEPCIEKKKSENPLPLREEILEKIVAAAPADSLFISTTGKTSRELFEIREKFKLPHDTDFYTVGSMGCASSIALGVATGDHGKPVFIIDGDGAALMQMGTFAALGKHGQNRNITHIIIDNQAHESTGGQPTLSSTVSFEGVAKNCGYKFVYSASSIAEVEKNISELIKNNELKLLVVRSKKGSRTDLGRPTTTPVENKTNFMNCIKNG